MHRQNAMSGIVLASALVLTAICAAPAGADHHKQGKLKALIVDGQNNHNWQATTPVLRHTLEASGRFTVDVATAKKPKQFTPDFDKYDVIVSNYNGPSWPQKTKNAFERYMKNGGGFVVVHAADNSFPGWGEYNRMIGLGGWGGRNESDGPYVRYRDGELVRLHKKGRGGTHGAQWAFPVTTRRPSHPIMKGLPKVWRQAEDELYAMLRGPAKQMTVLATAPSKKTGDHEPQLMTIDYHDGRVFHTTLGHDVKAMRSAAFQFTLQRGAEWAATGKVTLDVPEDFPGSDEPVLRPWPAE